MVCYNDISPRPWDCRFEVTGKTDESTVIDYVNTGINLSTPYNYFDNDDTLHIF